MGLALVDEIHASRHKRQAQEKPLALHLHNPVRADLARVAFELTRNAYRPVDVAPASVGRCSRQQHRFLMDEARGVESPGKLLVDETRGELSRDKARMLDERRLKGN